MKSETLRDRNKGDKLRRITAAARDLFDKQGFDATLMRDIASQAHVGLATLFLYASDKRDLLFLSCNDDLEALTAQAFSEIDRTADIIDQLVTAFEHFFEFYGRDPRLSRDLLREMNFYASGQHGARHHARRQRTIRDVEALIRAARERGALRSTATDSDIAHVIFYVFSAEVRRWLGMSDRSPVDGIAHFRRLLEVVVAGLG